MRRNHGQPATDSAATQRLAVLLVGHGSVRAGAGAAMIRLAARVRAADVAPIAAAGFLNYSQPTFADALARCAQAGASEVVVQPYFLVPGKFVRENLTRMIERFQLAHPELTLRMAEPFGDHPALARLVLKRALEADYLAANPQVALPGPRTLKDGAHWRPLHTLHPTGLLVMAHGSPDPASNMPIYGVAERIRATGRYAAVTVCFMDLNHPTIPEAIGEMIANRIRHIIAAPYFLQLGNHVIDDLPAIIGTAREQHSDATILLAEHLGYDRLLVVTIADRVAAAIGQPRRLDWTAARIYAHER